MIIIATGPNGEKFTGQASLWITQNGYESEVRNHNARETAAVQAALETWCKAIGTTPEKSQEEKED